MREVTSAFALLYKLDLNGWIALQGLFACAQLVLDLHACVHKEYQKTTLPSAHVALKVFNINVSDLQIREKHSYEKRERTIPPLH